MFIRFQLYTVSLALTRIVSGYLSMGWANSHRPGPRLARLHGADSRANAGSVATGAPQEAGFRTGLDLWVVLGTGLW
jgi:hypothetical protein